RGEQPMRAILVGLAAGVGIILSSGVVSAAGIITTIAGGGPGAGIPAAEQPVSAYSLVFDPAGNLYLSNGISSRLERREGATGLLVPVAGRNDGLNNGLALPCGTDLGDGGPATVACIQYPGGIDRDVAGNLYVADFGNQRIRKVDAVTGIITTVAGGG